VCKKVYYLSLMERKYGKLGAPTLENKQSANKHCFETSNSSFVGFSSMFWPFFSQLSSSSPTQVERGKEKDNAESDTGATRLPHGEILLIVM